ncbi:hypothetical protein P154DRAFT_222229 [Amniculicola lignicola CBS 123094]|uniref:Uncharacterized protein n=1 Tax=Amniculicola lignicola CBS 123094 TaxID=1392246 RepID=A0A6A5WZQ6_9PLEO|nr:hypothetical protein P154DRAFT_222229 [Amniculicola lignicola CBS 123094]
MTGGWLPLRSQLIKFQGSVPYDRMRAVRQHHQSLVDTADVSSLSAFAQRLDHILALSVDGTFLSTLPYDHVYALLGIADAPADLPAELQPDYLQSYGQVCFAYTKFLIEQTGNLNMLARLGRRSVLGRLFVNEHEDIPSWVPDLRVRSYLCVKPDVRASVSFSANGRCMAVPGVFLGHPKNVVQPMTYDAPLLPDDVRANRIEEEILRKSANFNHIPFEDVCRSWLSSFTANTSYQNVPIDTMDRMFSQIKIDPHEASFREIDAKEEQLDEALFPIQQSFKTLLMSNAQFLTTSSFIGSLQRGSERTQEDDVVCVLKSMVSAALLRPSGSRFRFVGLVHLRCLLREVKFDEQFFSSREVRTFDII